MINSIRFLTNVSPVLPYPNLTLPCLLLALQPYIDLLFMSLLLLLTDPYCSQPSLNELTVDRLAPILLPLRWEQHNLQYSIPLINHNHIGDCIDCVVLYDFCGLLSVI